MWHWNGWEFFMNDLTNITVMPNYWYNIPTWGSKLNVSLTKLYICYSKDCTWFKCKKADQKRRCSTQVEQKLKWQTKRMFFAKSTSKNFATLPTLSMITHLNFKFTLNVFLWLNFLQFDDTSLSESHGRAVSQFYRRSFLLKR